MINFDQLIAGATWGQVDGYRNGLCFGCALNDQKGRGKLYLSVPELNYDIRLLCDLCMSRGTMSSWISRELTAQEYFTLLSYY